MYCHTSSLVTDEIVIHAALELSKNSWLLAIEASEHNRRSLHHVIHARNQYVGPHGESTNKVENYFSIFKRGMRGIYQHCSEKHLQRYLAEFDFRYNNRTITDAERADKALEGIAGKRLTYRRTGEGAHV